MNTQTIKKCTKCKTEYPAMLEYFYLRRQGKNGLDAWCRSCKNMSKRKYASSPKGRLQQNNWRKHTLCGYLHRKYRDIQRRCNNPKSKKHSYCQNQGIKCLFNSVSEFVNWALENCKFPKMPFEVHRINSRGHYEKGNIEFLKRKEHNAKHSTKITCGRKC